MCIYLPTGTHPFGLKTEYNNIMEQLNKKAEGHDYLAFGLFVVLSIFASKASGDMRNITNGLLGLFGYFSLAWVYYCKKHAKEDFPMATAIALALLGGLTVAGLTVL